MPKSKVIADAVNGAVPLERTLRRLEVLAHDVGNEKLERWAECEIEGYDVSEVPDYRIASSLNFTYSGINGNCRVSNASLSFTFFSEEILEDLKKVPFREGIATLTKLGNADSLVHVDRSYLAGEVSDKSKGVISCLSISQNFPPDYFKGVVGKATTRAIKALMMLEDQYGSLDDLGIEVDSNKAASDNNAVINNTIFNSAPGNVNLPAPVEKEGFGSKVAWNVVVPIITAVLGALASAIAMHFLTNGAGA